MTARRTCPLCGRGDRDRTLVMFDSGAVHCHRCGRDAWREIKAALRDVGELPEAREPTRPAPAPSAGLADWWAELWRGAKAPSGEGRAYLDARSCVLPPRDGDLRWLPRMKHWPSGYLGPALVALITDLHTCKPLSLHFTWVRPDGTKARIERPRLLAARHSVKGGVIRLWPDEAVTHGLALAEGIETALSVAHAFEPVWSCIDAGHLHAFPVLAGIESLLIAIDGDAAGRSAANACAARWLRAGREVATVDPGDGRDLNDEAAA